MATLRLTALAAAAVAGARGDLNFMTWPNTAFAGAPNVSIVPCVNLSTPNWIPAYSTARFTGSIVSPVDDLILFTGSTDGALRVWVDDHLIIDDFLAAGLPRPVTAVYNMPMTAGVPLPLRIEYIHGSTIAPLLVLEWIGNSTTETIVPPSALTPTVAPAEATRQALRDSFLTPAVPWQTWDVNGMATHVHMPTGFSVAAQLGDVRDMSTTGGVRVWSHNNPARVRMGPHSYNGSDYTELTVDAWGGRNCSVLLQSTVDAAGDLIMLATANGSDCASLVLLVQPGMKFGRAGNIGGSIPGVFTAQLPGFADMSVFSASGAGVWFLTDWFIYWALPLTPYDNGVGYVGFSSSTTRTISQLQAAIAAAQARMAAWTAAQVPPALQGVFVPMQTILAWNTIFSAINSVITPVSRTWAWGAEQSLLFDWDCFFSSYMLSLTPGMARDVAYNTAIEVLQGRTVEGFVPNFWEGTSGSSDRSEPQVGSMTLLRMYNKLGDAWLLEKSLDSLLAWNDWTWTRRQAAGGVYASQGLIVLGSDPNEPPSDSNTNTLNGARLESGQDNSPMYDGVDNGLGPVTFDTVEHHMQLYEVGQTALFVADCLALVEIATLLNRTDLLPTLQQRAATSGAALNKYLWNATLGSYVNVLYSGEPYARFGVTYFYPMLSGTASVDQAESLISNYLVNPDYFCVTTTQRGVANASMLVRFSDSSRNVSLTCVTDDCLQQAINDGRYNFAGVEAQVAIATSANDTLPLCLWHDANKDTYALGVCSAPPPPAGTAYTLVRTEGAIAPAASPGRVPLTAWLSASTGDYVLCGTSSCAAALNSSGYTSQGVLGFAFDASTPATLPCKFGVPPSIARTDAAFQGGTGWYWRGRAWAPHAQLLYWALTHPLYANMPSVIAARQTLVAEGARLLEQEWAWFRHVDENVNPLTGIGSDNDSADPAYHWGALFGFISVLEAGLY